MFVIGEEYFQIEVTIESLDGFINIILTDGFFWDWNEFHAEAKDSRRGCRDYLLGCVVVKLLVSEVGKVYPRGGFA